MSSLFVAYSQYYSLFLFPCTSFRRFAFFPSFDFPRHPFLPYSPIPILVSSSTVCSLPSWRNTDNSYSFSPLMTVSEYPSLFNWFILFCGCCFLVSSRPLRSINPNEQIINTSPSSLVFFPCARFRIPACFLVSYFYPFYPRDVLNCSPLCFSMFIFTPCSCCYLLFTIVLTWVHTLSTYGWNGNGLNRLFIISVVLYRGMFNFEHIYRYQ